MTENKINYKSIYYPPGGILMWIIIYLELFTFGMAILAMAYYGSQDFDLFHKSRMQLDIKLGVTNTIILLTSGFFMANAVEEFKKNNLKKASQFINLTMLFGVLFIIVKSIEYYHKIEAGISLDTNIFFSFYWLLTGFHLIHILVGLVILLFINHGINSKNSTSKIEDIEASATFWHMCDLIWLLLFPILYLLF